MADFSRAELSTIIQQELRGSPLSVLVRQMQGRLLSGAGTPEGAVTAPPSVLYQRVDGAAGTMLYQKRSGTGSSGWAAIA